MLYKLRRKTVVCGNLRYYFVFLLYTCDELHCWFGKSVFHQHLDYILIQSEHLLACIAVVRKTHFYCDCGKLIYKMNSCHGKTVFVFRHGKMCWLGSLLRCMIKHVCVLICCHARTFCMVVLWTRWWQI